MWKAGKSGLVTRLESRARATCPADLALHSHTLLGVPTSFCKHFTQWLGSRQGSRHITICSVPVPGIASSWQVFKPMSHVHRFSISGLVRRGSGGAAKASRACPERGRVLMLLSGSGLAQLWQLWP